MTCDECDKITEGGKGDGGVAPYRIGNKEIGFASILIVGCNKHLKLAIDRLNKVADLEVYELGGKPIVD
jgi:hypothetical protein